MDFKKRLISGLVLVAVFAPLLFLGGYFFYALMAIFAFIGVFEVLRAAGFIKKISLPFTITLSLFASIIVLCFMVNDMLGTNVLHFTFAGGAILFAVILALPIFISKLKVSDSLFLIGTYCYVCLGFMLMGKIRATYFLIDNEIAFTNFNYNFRTSGLILYAYALCVCLGTDVFAYLLGSKFGRHKLCEAISPNKTIEGAIAGCVFGTLAGSAVLILAIFIFNFKLFSVSIVWNIVIAVIMSFFLSICCQIGDLVASKLKREFGIKDFSNLLPGHGGIMDRFDSMLFVMLVFGSIILLLGII